MLPQDKGNESPASLDGSPYVSSIAAVSLNECKLSSQHALKQGFYFAPSTTGSTKWTIYLQGGGWCVDEIDCLCRSKMNLGTSKLLSPTKNCGCSNPKEDGGVETECNSIWAPYLDGASMAGYRADPWPVPGTNETVSNIWIRIVTFGSVMLICPYSLQLTFRGIKNFDAVVDFAMANGMTKATEFALHGTSAGAV
jgi:hypothetical protein